jgi:NAD(P)-dependent dehydrogenase (short-subunit alcohol dehydrogenase family)
MTEPTFAELLSFDGRVAVVTGAASGIGAACARRFAELGASLVLVDRDGVHLAEIAGSLPGSIAVPVDLTDSDAPAKVVTDALAAFDRIDVLVNGAGIFPHHSTLEMSVDDWDAVIGLNLRATFTMAQACAREMVERGGAIVNIASASATQPRPGMAAYAASKGGVVSLTRSLALDLGPTVRVNAVAPGPITDTKGARTSLPVDDDEADAALAAYGSAIPLKRTGRADEVARLIVFLASPAASYITAEVVSIDGGRSLG